MKKNEVEIGKVYAVKVSGMICPVRITNESRFGGWDGTNLQTNRDVRIRSAMKLRYELEPNPETGKWRPAQGEAWWRRKAEILGKVAVHSIQQGSAVLATRYATAAAKAALNILGRE